MFIPLKRTLLALQIAGLALLPTIAQAGASCKQMSGWVWLASDSSCRIISEYPGNNYLAQAKIPNTCFSVFLYLDGVGIVPTVGSAGLTSENMMALGGVAQTPAFINEAGVSAKPNEFGVPETRRFLTARSVLKLGDGKLFTADAIVAGNDGTDAEQLIVTGGTGPYANTKGKIYVQGKSIDNWGRFNGELCSGQ